MRARLAALLFIPTLIVLLVLGAAFVGSNARESQQQLVLDRLRDVNYLSGVATQSISADDPSLVAGDLERYGEVYGIGAAVLDRGGRVWATNGLDPSARAETQMALAGKRSEITTSLWPWKLDELVVAEPMFQHGDLVGAIVTESDTSYLSGGIWRNWLLIGLATILVSVAALVLSGRTAIWVLRPVRAVENAMTAIGHGDLTARIPESAGPPELAAVVARFNSMAEHVEHAMSRQQEFVSNAAHELRNPLNALTLRIEGLDLSLAGEHAQEATTVRNEAARMAHILDALLLLAEGARPEGDEGPLDVREVLAGRVQSWATTDGNAITIKDHGAEELLADVNPSVLNSALDTVLDNALKFSRGQAPVEVAARAAGEVVLVEVRDHGAGVPPEELDRLTERFWRSPRHRGVVKGSGLGLAVCAELVELGGGSLRFSPPRGGGLLVTIALPRWEDGDQ